MIVNHLDCIGKQLNIFGEKYENFIIMGETLTPKCVRMLCKYFVILTNLFQKY